MISLDEASQPTSERRSRSRAKCTTLAEGIVAFKERSRPRDKCAKKDEIANGCQGQMASLFTVAAAAGELK